MSFYISFSSGIDQLSVPEREIVCIGSFGMIDEVRLDRVKFGCWGLRNPSLDRIPVQHSTVQLMKGPKEKASGAHRPFDRTPRFS